MDTKARLITSTAAKPIISKIHNYATMMAQPDPIALAQQNAAMRAALLSTAPRMRKNVGTFSSTGLNTTTRVKLFNVGVLTKLQLECSVDITIGTANATASPKAPWNLINRIRLTDYDGTDRVNLSGFQLFMLNCVRTHSYFGFNNDAATAQLVNPLIPTAQAAATLRFYIDVPLAFDIENPVIQLRDLRGSILAQTAVGEMYLSIDWTNSLYTNGDVDSVYNGAATTTVVLTTAGVGPSVTVWQEYLLPQAIGGQGQVPLPALDLSTVYELNGNVRSSDNIVVNNEKLISYPNVRSVIGAYVNYVTGGVASNAISLMRLIANGNNILTDHSLRSQQFEQRRALNGDSVAGAFFKLHRDKPIETALFGNVQLGVTPSTVSGGAQYMETAFESFYTKGQALPGLQQSST